MRATGDARISRSTNGNSTFSAAATSSTRKRCDQRTSGRNSRMSKIRMITSIASIARSSAGTSRTAMACDSIEPMPGRLAPA